MLLKSKEYTSSECVLGVVSHGISLVQNNEFVLGFKDGPCRRKIKNLTPNNPNTTVIRRIQLKHHGVELIRSIHLLCNCKNRTCLPSTCKIELQSERATEALVSRVVPTHYLYKIITWWTIEEEMRQLIF